MGGIMVKLPVFDVLGRAFTAPARYGWPLLPYFLCVAAIAIGIMWLIFGLIPSGVSSTPVNGATIDQGSGASFWLGFFGIILVIVLFVSVAVLVHRQAAGVPDIWKLGWPTLRYIGVSILISLLAGIVSAVAFFAASILGGGPEALFGIAMGAVGEGTPILAIVAVLLATIAIYAVYARISLALPATAIGEQGTISLAWEISRGNTLRLLAAWLLYFILVVVLRAIAGFLAGGSSVFSGEETTVMSVFGTIVSVIFLYYYVVFGIAFLTYSYLALAPNKDMLVTPSSQGTPSDSAGGSS